MRCPKDSARGSVETIIPGLTPMIAPPASRSIFFAEPRGARGSHRQAEHVSNSTRSSSPDTGSDSPFIKPSSACSRERRSAVDEAEELKTLAHISWHQPRIVVATGDQPFGLYPRQGHPVHAPLPSCSAWALSGSRAATVGAPAPSPVVRRINAARKRTAWRNSVRCRGARRR